MSERVSKDMFERVIANRPFKLDEDEVSYRKSEGDEACHDCVHFFERVKDKFHTCEIFRPTGKQESVNPEYVCDFFTDNGTDFPLLED
jgi:hypothetical protein